MSQDETEFDKLLKETREWEARDRARHGPSAMSENDAAPVVPGPTRTPAKAAEPISMKQKPAQAAIPKLKVKGASGWFWLLVFLYFAFKFFTR
ncbi:MAG TPA: hypothetical protein VHQ02_07560 [Usitatibacter sp.]|nr:hypothetical protein [Usitatibacter sp.]